MLFSNVQPMFKTMDGLEMNRTTQLTKSILGFMEDWNAYKKGLKGLKNAEWCKVTLFFLYIYIEKSQKYAKKYTI